MTRPSNAGTPPPHPRSAVRLCGSAWSACGYCRGARGAAVGRGAAESARAYTVLADALAPDAYEALLQRGWRRSGRALYRPDNGASCCPAITIRLAVDRFQPTRSQRRLLHRAARLGVGVGNATPAAPPPNHAASADRTVPALPVQALHESGILDKLCDWTTQILRERLREPQLLPPVAYKAQARRRHRDPAIVTLSCSACAAIAGRSKGLTDRAELVASVVEQLNRRLGPAPPEAPLAPPAADEEASSNLGKVGRAPLNGAVAHKKHKPDRYRAEILSFEAHQGSGQILVHLKVATVHDASSVAFAEADTKLDSDMTVRNESDGPTETASHESSQKLAAWWSKRYPEETPPPAWQGLQITTLPAHEAALDPATHRLYFLYQHEVHNDDDPFALSGSSLTTKEDELFAWADKAPADWLAKVKSMLQVEYTEPNLRNRIIEAFGHYYTFLVDNPFVADDAPEGAHVTRAGTYHQLYHLEGKLVAVGVVDVLPHGLSSVYLFYDPSFVLPLGKYAILREIDWTRQHDLPYYYLGYYIHSCPKMRYKADYYPSELLCPVTGNWVDAEEAKQTIAEKSPEHNYCQLFLGIDQKAAESMAVAPSQIRLEVGMGQLITVERLHARGQALIAPLVEEFIREAGPVASTQCIINFV